MHALRQDLRFAVRMLAKSPGFAAVAILTLALGIGVNTAVFSIVTAVLLRALPYPDAERLVELNESHRSDPVLTAYGVSGPNFRDWRAASRSFTNLGIHEWAEFWLREGGDIRPVRGRRVSADFLPTLGIQPMLGRGFRSEDEIAGGVALLSHEFWERQYGRDANVIGQTIDLIDQVPTVVGVLPPSFGFPGRPELLVPLSASGQLMSDRGWRLGNAVGRLKPGVSLRQAQAEMETIGRQLSEEYAAENKEWGIRVTSMRSKMTERVRPALPLMLGVATFVLLIAAANLGNLLLARATARQKELAIRAALGAGRWRLIRQLLVESLLLSLLGGAAGLLAVIWSRGLLVSWVGPHLPRFAEIRVDGVVWAFAFAVAVLAGLLCGLVPAWRLVRTELSPTLKESGQRTAVDRAGSWLRSTLVVSELALAIVLLVGAGLALRSVYYLLRPGLGVDPANVLVFEVRLPDKRYPAESSERLEFFTQLLVRIMPLPGVEAVAASSLVPFVDRAQMPVAIEGRGEAPDQPTRWAGFTGVTPDFFRTVGLPLLQGRAFTAEDRPGAPAVAVINETMAWRYWPGENPIGKRFATGRAASHGEWITVVGVVRDFRAGGAENRRRPEVYHCYLQSPWLRTVLVRAAGDPMNLVPQVQSLVSSVDRSLPRVEVDTLDQILDDSADTSRVLARLLVFFAGLALSLAVVGIDGVISYAVTMRTHEFGLRVALGAQKMDVAILVLKWGGRLALLGAGLGLLLACWLTRLLVGLLDGVNALDPITYAAVAVLLLGAALLACYLPARRATAVDPIVALRYE